MSLLKSTTLNPSRHIGLQQLEALAAANRGFLGPIKFHKFIQEEASGDAVLVCSCYRLLEQLELNGSVAQLLHETICAHRKVLHSGTTSLVFLAGAWSRVALECLHRGIAISFIVAGMSKGLDLCVKACRRSAVSVEEVCRAAFHKRILSDSVGDGNVSVSGLSLQTGFIYSTQDRVNVMNNGTKATMKHRIRLKHSRHFNVRDETDAGESNSVQGSGKTSSQAVDIVHLAEAVTHGCKTSMGLVIEAGRIQSKVSHGNQNILDVTRLVTCSLPGLSEEHSGVLHGFVVVVDSEQALLTRRLERRVLKMCLLNGDLSENHRHVGFNRLKDALFYSDPSNMTGVGHSQEWIENALKILRLNQIDIILLSGVVTSHLKDHCLSHDILVIEHVRPSILSDFAKSTGALPVAYITQLTERCVGAGVRVSVVREVHSTGMSESALINVVAEGSALVTALITSSVHAKLQSLEDEFWGCAYRLHHALTEGKLLPGAGAAELLCIHQLQKHANVSVREQRGDATRERFPSASPDETVILQLMAEAWMDYISTLVVNAGQIETKAQAWTRIAQCIKHWERTSTGKAEGLMTMETYSEMLFGEKEKLEREAERVAVGVYDNVNVKFETWRRALDLVLLVLLTDTEVVTGVNNSDSQYKDYTIL